MLCFLFCYNDLYRASLRWAMWATAQGAVNRGAHPPHTWLPEAAGSDASLGHCSGPHAMLGWRGGGLSRAGWVSCLGFTCSYENGAGGQSRGGPWLSCLHVVGCMLGPGASRLEEPLGGYRALKPPYQHLLDTHCRLCSLCFGSTGLQPVVFATARYPAWLPDPSDGAPLWQGSHLGRGMPNYKYTQAVIFPKAVSGPI